MQPRLRPLAPNGPLPNAGPVGVGEESKEQTFSCKGTCPTANTLKCDGPFDLQTQLDMHQAGRCSTCGNPHGTRKTKGQEYIAKDTKIRHDLSHSRRRPKPGLICKDYIKSCEGQWIDVKHSGCDAQFWHQNIMGHYVNFLCPGRQIGRSLTALELISGKDQLLDGNGTGEEASGASSLLPESTSDAVSQKKPDNTGGTASHHPTGVSLTIFAPTSHTIFDSGSPGSRTNAGDFSHDTPHMPDVSTNSAVVYPLLRGGCGEPDQHCPQFRPLLSGDSLREEPEIVILLICSSSLNPFVYIDSPRDSTSANLSATFHRFQWRYSDVLPWRGKV